MQNITAKIKSKITYYLEVNISLISISYFLCVEHTIALARGNDSYISTYQFNYKHAIESSWNLNLGLLKLFACTRDFNHVWIWHVAYNKSNGNQIYFFLCSIDLFWTLCALFWLTFCSIDFANVSLQKFVHGCRIMFEPNNRLKFCFLFLQKLSHDPWY
jgi:hypothetical protein